MFPYVRTKKQERLYSLFTEVDQCVLPMKMPICLMPACVMPAYLKSLPSTLLVFSFRPLKFLCCLNIVIALGLGSFTQAANAPEASFIQGGLSLFGKITQGGLIRASAPKATEVLVFDQKIRPDKQGNFVFGIGRDAPANIDVLLTFGTDASQTIRVPVEQREYQLQRIDGVDNKYVGELSPELKKRTKSEATMVWQARQTLRETAEFAEGFGWPAEGPITGVYGSQRIFNGVPKRPHYGLDIAGPVGTPVVAPAAGLVTLADSDMYYSGGTLIIDHGQGVSSTFIHLSEILVKKGELVNPGKVIAKIGATGRATGPHLDWRINWFNQRLDPALVLPEKQGNK